MFTHISTSVHRNGLNGVQRLSTLKESMYCKGHGSWTVGSRVHGKGLVYSAPMLHSLKCALRLQLGSSGFWSTVLNRSTCMTLHYIQNKLQRIGYRDTVTTYSPVEFFSQGHPRCRLRTKHPLFIVSDHKFRWDRWTSGLQQPSCTVQIQSQLVPYVNRHLLYFIQTI